MAQPVKLLTEFLRHCGEQEKELEDYQVILRILQYATNKLEGKAGETVKQACGKLLLSFACAQTVQQAMKKGEGFDLARTLDLPMPSRRWNWCSRPHWTMWTCCPMPLPGTAHHDHHVMELYEDLIPGFEEAFGQCRKGKCPSRNSWTGCTWT